MPPVHKRLHIHLDTTSIWVDDELKALQAQGFKLPKKQKHQKATLAELLTLAIFLLLQGQDLAKGYLAAKTTLKAYFPSLPHLSRFYRVLQKAPELLAHLAVRLSGGQGLLQVVDLKPIPLAHGHRILGLNLPEAAVGVGPLGAFGGYVLMPVMNERGLILSLSLGPPSRERPGDLGKGAFGGPPRGLGGPGIPLGPRGQDPALPGSWGGRWWRRGGGGGSRVSVSCWGGSGTGLRSRFSVMVRSLGLHRIAAFPSGKHLAARSFWGLAARVNLILFGPQPHSEPGLAQDGRGGAMS
jgi:hypothetical protein